MEADSKAWTGRDGDKKYPSVTELIDRYVPLRTRGAVYAMSRVYEDRIFDLMRTIHDYHLRCEAMANHMDGMEKEFYPKVAVPVHLGNFEASTMVNPMDWTKSYEVVWRPDPYSARYVMSDRLIHKDEQPHLFEMMMRQFKEHIQKTLFPKLEREFAMLYARSPR
ncbi:hypothetical protein [Mesorhizobium sp. M1329]|uniref:hypothetical protein n=1 Tax=Mesorhizobium sp. M1329 TaxID=2957083 RepID=UPI00333E1605